MIFLIDIYQLKKWKKHLKKDLKGLNIEFKPLTLSDEQIKEVKELEEKYRSDEWLYKNKNHRMANIWSSYDFLFYFSFYIFCLFYIYVDLQLRKRNSILNK